MSSKDTRFKKGQSGNPSGISKEQKQHFIEFRTFKETTYKDFIEQLQKYGEYTIGEIEEEITKPDTRAFEVIFGKIVLGAAKGDKDARAVLLDRLWGKVKEAKEVELDIRSLSPEKMLEAGRAALQVLEAEVKGNK